MNTNLKIENEIEFNWNNIVDETAISFRLTNDERRSLYSSRIARLIGALPFLAGCDEAERTSLAHIGTYLVAARGSKTTFNHNYNDDKGVMNRLEEIGHFKGGNQAILEKGMKLLALNMVHGYMRDIEYDKSINKYNPISAGVWDYKLLVKSLTDDIKSIKCSEMDPYGTCESVVFDYWSRR